MIFDEDNKHHYPPSVQYKAKDPKCRSNILAIRLVTFGLKIERDRIGYKIYNKNMKIICLNLNYVEEFILFLENNYDRA